MIPASPVPSVCTTRLRPAANALLTARHALDAGAVATARRALAHAAGVVRYTRQQARAWSVPAASLAELYEILVDVVATEDAVAASRRVSLAG